MLDELLERGYVKTQALDDAESALLSAACAPTLAVEGAIKDSDNLVRTMLPPYEEPAIQHLLGRAHEVVTSIGLKDALFWSSRLINKVPGEKERSWHQDWHWWGDDIAYREMPPQIGVMVYLQATDEANGALRVIPGMHRNTVLIRSLYLNYEPCQPDGVTVGCTPNEFVIIDARLPHATHANSSDKNRAMITMWFIPQFSELPAKFQSFFLKTREYKLSPEYDDIEFNPYCEPLPSFDATLI